MWKVLKTDLYRCFCNILFPFSVFGVVFVCLLSECYIDDTEKSYTVLSMILARKQLDSAIRQINYLDVWKDGIGQWAHIILPFLLTASYIYYLSEERNSGVILYYKIRSRKWGYCLGKTLCALLSGGIVMTAGYLLYGGIVIWNFGSIHMLWGDLRQVIIGTICVFVYGMLFSIYGYAVSICFRDKNILWTFPMMLSYLYSAILEKVETELFNHEKWDAYQYLLFVQIENMIGHNSYQSKLITMGIFTGVYILLLLCFVKRTGKNAI